MLSSRCSRGSESIENGERGSSLSPANTLRCFSVSESSHPGVLIPDAGTDDPYHCRERDSGFHGYPDAPLSRHVHVQDSLVSPVDRNVRRPHPALEVLGLPRPGLAGWAPEGNLRRSGEPFMPAYDAIVDDRLSLPVICPAPGAPYGVRRMAVPCMMAASAGLYPVTERRQVVDISWHIHPTQFPAI